MKKKKINQYTGVLLLFVVLAGMTSSDMVTMLFPERPLAYVRKFKPTVTILTGQEEIKASGAEQLFNGDTLRTGDNGFALVQFMDKSIAKVKPNSELIVYGEINNKQSSSARIALELGEIFLNVTKRSTTNFEVATRTSVASVKGTQFGARHDSYYWVMEGVVELFSNESGQSTKLRENMYGRINEDGSIETGELSDEEIDNLNKEYEQLENTLEPETIQLHFRDQNGQLREIELRYFENSN